MPPTYHARMSTGRRVCETIHLTVLGLWLGTLVMTGAAAAVIFPTVREFDPRLPKFAAYTGDHWSLLAGKVAATLFFICDSVQFAGVLVAGVTLGVAILWFGLPMTRLSTALRGGLLIILIAVLSFQFFVLAPRMNRNLFAYWQAAETGENEAASTLKAAFDADHPLARNLLAVDTILVLALLTAGVWSATSGARALEPRTVCAEPELEVPLLARSIR